MIYIVLSLAIIALGVTAQVYKNQRDDLAAAWMYFHPEDFPDLVEDDA